MAREAVQNAVLHEPGEITTNDGDPYSVCTSSTSCAEREGVLWITVGVTYLLDVALTAYGLSLGFEEANPVARSRNRRSTHPARCLLEERLRVR